MHESVQVAPTVAQEADESTAKILTAEKKFRQRGWGKHLMELRAFFGGIAPFSA